MLVEELRGLIDEAQGSIDARHAAEMEDLAEREDVRGSVRLIASALPLACAALFPILPRDVRDLVRDSELGARLAPLEGFIGLGRHCDEDATQSPLLIKLTSPVYLARATRNFNQDILSALACCLLLRWPFTVSGLKAIRPSSRLSSW